MTLSMTHDRYGKCSVKGESDTSLRDRVRRYLMSKYPYLVGTDKLDSQTTAFIERLRHETR